MSAQRIQLRRTRGWRKPEGAIVVARPTRWGNPYVVGDRVTAALMGRMDGTVGQYDPSDTRFFDSQREVVLTAEDAVRLYREDLMMVIETASEHDPRHLSTDESECVEIVDALRDLAGHDLACWCDLAQPCHADVLIEVSNELRRLVMAKVMFG